MSRASSEASTRSGGSDNDIFSRFGAAAASRITDPSPRGAPAPVSSDPEDEYCKEWHRGAPLDRIASRCAIETSSNISY